jgi:hypothetical protein
MTKGWYAGPHSDQVSRFKKQEKQKKKFKKEEKSKEVRY